MVDHEMLAAIDAPTLAEAFTVKNCAAAMEAGKDAARRLASRQWTERFFVRVGGETVLVPARLHFVSERPLLPDDTDAWLFARALQTRSSDGFERQRAARDLLGSPQSSIALFIVSLIGEYIVEILDDISAAMTPELEKVLCSFLVENPAYRDTVKRRVTSYWNVYYRARWLNEQGRAEQRDEYVGFRLIQQLEAAVLRCAPL